MDDIRQLASLFNKVRRQFAKDVCHDYRSLNSSRNVADELVVYDNKPDRDIKIRTCIKEDKYIFLTTRYVAKFKCEDTFYDFIVFDLRSEKEMYVL
jgi:hypothetical protein